MVIKYNGIITPSIQSEEYNRIQLENKEIRRDYNFEILTSSDVKNLITKTVNIQTSFVQVSMKSTQNNIFSKRLI